MRKITLRITEEDYELAFSRSQASTQSINAFFVGLLHQSDGINTGDDGMSDGINTKSDGMSDGICLEARLAQKVLVSLWTRSHFCGTIRKMFADTVKRYVAEIYT
jgi:hypothetical protein